MNGKFIKSQASVFFADIAIFDLEGETEHKNTRQYVFKKYIFITTIIRTQNCMRKYLFL
jgi:hypothetical protein